MLFIDNYKLEFRSTKHHIDAMSRLPVSTTFDPLSDNVNCNFFGPVTNIDKNCVKRLTQRYPVLSRMSHYIVSGWQESTDPLLILYHTHRDELSTEAGCILWGQGVIIPSTLRRDVLQELHVSHPGIKRMKALSRSYMWWPNMDESMETTVNNCSICQSMHNLPDMSPYHPWVIPSAPWTHIQIDYLGPVNGNMYFVIVDAHSKFPEVVKMKSITSSSTIRALREIFSRHGILKSIVSDNGPQFFLHRISIYFSKWVIEFPSTP